MPYGKFAALLSWRKSLGLTQRALRIALSIGSLGLLLGLVWWQLCPEWVSPASGKGFHFLASLAALLHALLTPGLDHCLVQCVGLPLNTAWKGSRMWSLCRSLYGGSIMAN